MANQLGIDIGGTGIKGAVVDLKNGEFKEERFRVLTPQPATPDAVAGVVNEIVQHFNWKGSVGATFPAVVQKGMVHTAANVDASWIETDAAAIFSKATGRNCTVINDADAAGIAEVRFGAAKDAKGTVVVVTLGTGIGSAVFLDGNLLPNTELGHLEINGKDAEKKASEVARERDQLSWKKWSKRVERYLQHLEALLWPDLIVIGGGISKKSEKFLPLISTRTKVVPALLHNEAGIVGAALAAE